MAICIYCRTNPADSREHWLPQWMGAFRDAGVLRDRLCTSCNKRLGDQLDHEMSRTGPEALERFRLKLGDTDTDWERSNPFNFRSQQVEPPTVAKVTFPGEDHELLMEDIPGTDPPKRRAQRQIIVRDSEGRGHPVRLPIHCTGDWLQVAIRERGLQGGRLARVICEADGKRLPEWARKALAHVFPDARDIDWSLIEGGPEVNLSSALQIGLRAEYFRGLGKLAFHYFLHQCPQVDGHDEAFESIRGFIREGLGPVVDFVDPNAATFLLRLGDDPAVRDGHFFLLEMDNERVTVSMKLFAASHYSRPSVLVRIGRDPSRLVRQYRVGHFVRLYADRPRDGFDGEIVELQVAEHDGRWGVVTLAGGSVKGCGNKVRQRPSARPPLSSS